MKKSTCFTNKCIGIIILSCSLLVIILMLFHPNGLSDSSQNNQLKWVHGGIIFLLIVNAFGVGRFNNLLINDDLDMKLSLLFYYVGLGGFIIGAMIDGFVLSSLISFQKTDPATFISLTKYTIIINQAFAKLGVISFGAAGLFLFPLLISEKKLTRYVAITGCTVGTSLTITMLSGVYLTAMTMTILTVLIMVWHSIIGWWLFKN